MSEHKQCEGWRRYGGAFTMGPPKWDRCGENAIVILRVESNSEEKDVLACLKCWKEAEKSGGMSILSVKPL